MHGCSSRSLIEILETRIAPATVFAIDDQSNLLKFDPLDPASLSTVGDITGLAGGQTMRAIDFRPATGDLYGLATSGSGPYNIHLYRIDLETGAATFLFNASGTLSTTGGIGMDFNPVSDSLRVTDGAGQNLRVNPNNGVSTTDIGLTGSGSIAGVAYTNSYPGAASATLYGYSYTGDDLVRIGGFDLLPSPNGGVVTKIRDLPFTAQDANRVGFDILPTVDGNLGLLTLNATYTGEMNSTAKQRLAQIDLVSGTVINVQVLGTGTNVIWDLAAAPTSASWTAGKSFTYKSGDGDMITVKSNRGVFDPAKVTMISSLDGTRYEIVKLDVTGNATFDGADITVSVKKAAGTGDGLVEIGHIDATGLNLGKVSIPGNLLQIDAGANTTMPALKSLTVHSLGSSDTATYLVAPVSSLLGSLGTLKVKTDIVGAGVSVLTSIGSVTVGGSIIGGKGSGSGSIAALSAGTITIGGSLLGDAGAGSGGLEISLINKSLTIKGSVIGGSANDSGYLELGPAAKVIIGHSLVGGTGDESGRIFFTDPNPGSVTIGEDLLVGPTGKGGYITGQTIKSITIKGNFAGSADGAALIGFNGLSTPATQAESVAIGSLTIGGTVSHANILAGGQSLATMTNPNASIGKISIARDFLASNIVAGYKPGAQGLVGIGDTLAAADNLNAISSIIGSLTIKGTARGSSGDGDSFGIIADDITTLALAGRKLATATTRLDILTGSTNDLHIRELKP